tara:strand:- start:403 stop:798 length:396 start_codon:yes stop_codon:yes gene_type:complete
MILYKYIFYKIYLFYVRVFKEKEIPHWFAAGVLTLILVTNIVVLLDISLYHIYPEIIKSIEIYYKYFALFVLTCMVLFVNYKNRYKRILESCERLPKRKRKMLSCIGVLYVVALFVAFLWMGELIRAFNME